MSGDMRYLKKTKRLYKKEIHRMYRLAKNDIRYWKEIVVVLASLELIERRIEATRQEKRIEREAMFKRFFGIFKRA